MTDNFDLGNLEDTNITGGIGSYGKVEFSKPTIAMAGVMDCRNKRAKEMVSGYVTNKSDRMGNMFTVTIPDSRLEFISSVVALKTVLAPEIANEKTSKFIEAYKKIEEKKQKLFNKYCYKPFVVFISGVDGSKKLGRDKKAEGIMPSLGAVVEVPCSPTAIYIERIEGVWDVWVEAYITGLLEIYDEIFAELNLLIDRTGYFKKRAKIA